MAEAVVNDASFTVVRLAALDDAQTAPSIGIDLDGSVPFSIAAWIKLDGLGASASILSKAGVITFGTVADMVLLAIDGYPAVQSDARSHPLDEDDWHYVVATYASGGVRLYIDGEFDVFASISGSGSTSASPFLIGGGLQALVWGVTVYNQALDADTVMATMFGSADPSILVADFDFSIDPPVDRGAGHLPIALNGGAAMVASTPALALAGTAYAEPSGGGEVNPGGHQVDPYTVQAWVYLETTANLDQVVFVNSDLDSETGMSLGLEYDDSVSAFRVISQRGSHVDGDSLVSNGTVSIGRWANVATVFDGTTLSIYIDGAQDVAGPFGPIPLARNHGRPLIGAGVEEGEPPGSSALQGYISRVDVWARALSATEVTEYLNTAPDVPSVGLVAVYDFTAAPARNLVDAHPIGLADGARLGSQTSLGSGSVTSRSGQGGRPARRYARSLDVELDAATLRSIRESLRFDDFLAEHGADLEAAMDLDAAGPPAAEREVIAAAWQDVIARMRTAPGSVPFHVSRHVVGDEYVLLCHTRRGTHVAYRGPASDVDDCTMWKITLVFIVVAGVLDALFALPARLTPRAIAVLRAALAKPAIGTLLSRGGAMTAGGIFTLATTLYDLGMLRELVVAMLELGFWALMRMLARFALKLIGIGAADVIASLVATAATFIVTYLNPPTACSPLPTITLDSIKFNYDPTASAADAMSIRRNATTAVAVPEWSPGRTAAQSPAAYAIGAIAGKVVTIQAKFLAGAGFTGSAQVQATGGGILGAIAPLTVTFKNGVSVPEYVTISLTGQRLAAGGISVQDISWAWTYLPTGGTWTAMATTSHRVYAVLAVPTGPWVQSPTLSNDQLPWTDILDHSCVWAAGKTTADDAAAAVTQKVNGAIGLVYENSKGAGRYTTNSAGNPFQGTQFLQFLSAGTGNGNAVNCTDCATIVTTFANVLGCNVYASVMSGPGGFTLNKIIGIGAASGAWAYPFGGGPGTGFSYHEVAWLPTGSYFDPLYDACLQVDSSTNPWNWTNPALPHTALLPLKLPFDMNPLAAPPLPTPFQSLVYRARLATNDDAGINHCLPQGPRSWTPSGRRKVI